MSMKKHDKKDILEEKVEETIENILGNIDGAFSYSAGGIRSEISRFNEEQKISLLSTLKSEVEGITPEKREVNYHSSYNEGKIDFSEQVINLIEKHQK